MKQPVRRLGKVLFSAFLAVSAAACTFVKTEVVNPVGPTATDNCAHLQAALDSITDNGPANPYLIKLEPGLYECGETEIAMKEYVDIEGSGRGITEITGKLRSTQAVIQMASHTELRSLTVTNLSTPGGSVFIAIMGIEITEARVSDVTARVLNAGGGSAMAVFYSGPGTFEMDNVHALADSPAQRTCGIASSASPAGRGTVRLSNVIAEGQGATNGNTGFCERSQYQSFIDVYARDSVFIGSFASVLDPGGYVRIAHSQLIGPALGATGPKCIHSYDENYDPVGTDCN